MEPHRSRVRGEGGIELELYTWSDDGVPLLLLHGFGNDAHVWDDFAPVVAPYYRTLALDLRGHGRSDRDPQARYDHETMARDVEAVLDSLGIERVVIVGHSMGGRVGMRFAGRNPEKLAGFVIVDSGPDLDLRGISRIREEAEAAPTSFASVREFEEVLSLNYPVTPPATLSRLARHWLRERPDGRFEPRMDPALRSPRPARPADGERDAAAWMRREAGSLWDVLEKLPCPTLVVRGAASDVLSPETADRMVDEAIPNARLAVVARAGHAVMLDNAEGFAQAVSTFVFGED
jgi:pimeloyl-ACP methyl ester carboxylesterase